MKKILLTTLTLLSLTACSSSDKDLSGAGATFPAPYYNIVFRKYTEVSDNNVAYGAVGSGGGVRSLRDKTVDFGATDVFLSDKDLLKIGEAVVHIPTALGAVVISYNLDEAPKLNLNAEIVSGIYRGDITNWNDDKIKQINPDVNFPDQLITPVYRSDGSGTTAVFSEYMSKVDTEWKEKIGEGKALNFPVGIAAKGNPGIAGIVNETKGSIGYIGSEYALALKMPFALMQNSSGNFVKADTKSVSAAADTDLPDDTRQKITNSPNPDAYPISTFTWIIAYKDQGYNNRSAERAQSLVSLFNFIISEKGQDIATRTHYAPLSGVALEKTKRVIQSMTHNGQAIIVSNDSIK